jgi:hypothetical protein
MQELARRRERSIALARAQQGEAVAADAANREVDIVENRKPQLQQ